MDIPILSLLLFIPLAGVVLLAFMDGNNKRAIRMTTLAVAGLEFLTSSVLLIGFDAGTHHMQWVENMPWIPEIGVSYFLAVDGMSLLLVLLTTFIALLGVLCSWSAVQERVKGYMACLLIMETGMIGVFVSLDLVLFFLFWEISLVPMYFLIGIWGGERKLYATIKFFLYTLFGSVFMLVGILALYFAHGNISGEYTFNLLKLYQATYPYNLQWWVFLAFFLGFAIKVPVFPFHTWLPDAHVEAPTAGSVILAGVLLKMGTYAFLRFNLPLLPDASAAFTPFIMVLAVIGIIYGALLALAQKDLKKLVAYSSISHLGFVMAGIFAMNQQGIDGGILQMVNHGLSTGALFLIVGMIYDRRHSRLMDDFGGLARVMPVFAVFVMIVVFSSIGLPGTNGFIGEILILLGIFKISAAAAVLAATGIVLGAVYMLWMYQRVLFGPVTHPANKDLKDLNPREILTLIPIILLIFWIGIYPRPFLKLSAAGTTHLVEMAQSRQALYMNDKPIATYALKKSTNTSTFVPPGECR
ncbi:MAG: NADH-quinone oxidoreductase subunit M [Desulfobacteraceae bacterium]|nr:MAG: NADH-quinone oxidoreductase subunit M [Desulfobacteraceae bacterium]